MVKIQQNRNEVSDQTCRFKVLRSSSPTSGSLAWVKISRGLVAQNVTLEPDGFQSCLAVLLEDVGKAVGPAKHMGLGLKRCD